MVFTKLLVSGFAVYGAYICFVFFTFFYPFQALCNDAMDRVGRGDKCIGPLAKPSDEYVMEVFFSTQERFSLEGSVLVLKESDIGFKSDFERNVGIYFGDNVGFNDSVYLHVFLTPESTYEDESREEFVVYARSELTWKFVPLDIDDTDHLVFVPEIKDSEQPEPPPAAHLNEHVYVHLVSDFNWYNKMDVPVDLGSHFYVIRKYPNKFKPIVYVETISAIKENMKLLNGTNETESITIHFSPISLGHFRIWRLIERTLLYIDQSFLGFSSKDSEMLKKLFTQTNPILLGVTFAVSFLHLLFDCLSFKSDISFWQRRKTLKGISKSGLVLDCICKVIILLYFLDNEDEVSSVVLFSQILATIISLWKVAKVFHYSARKVLTQITSFHSTPHEPFPFICSIPAGPLLDKLGALHCRRKVLNDSASDSATVEGEMKDDALTEEYDQLAMGYLSYALQTFVLVYSLYSLLFREHRSWYSWIINSLANSVYTFGFAIMTPQLFINYKLKSVDHLPWKAMVYHHMNTFIDDLFAFVIPMPLVHRIACFRDDVIFFIYLYQRWIYPVDKKRKSSFNLLEGISESPKKKVKSE
eukprot:Nk52_evm68s270 gene=Nk52_evmTU68s270